VTLDKVPEELYSAIICNTGQVEEWKRLFAIQEIEGDLHTPKYTDPLSIEFLKANPFLVLDTAFFGLEFTEKLLAVFDNLDEAVDGLLVHSENFQALNFISNNYQNQVNAVYADPPYNTSASEIIYKNSYKHSSWLSLISDRLYLAKSLMTDKAISCVTIDDFEMQYLNMLLTEVFGEENRQATTVIRSKPQGRATAVGFSPNHEYGLFYSKTTDAVVGRIPRDEERSARYKERDEQGIYTWANFRKTGGDSLRENRPKSFYPVYVSTNGQLRIVEMKWDDVERVWHPSEPALSEEITVFPIDDDGTERVWTTGWDRAQQETEELLAREVGGRWQVYRKYRPNQEGALPGTWWDNSLYSASESGTKLLQKLFGTSGDFSYPKSLFAVIDCLRAANLSGNGTVLDFFAGSGTTGHATIVLNREDEGRRKYILIEMGDYFNTVLKPRIQKVIYSKDWKDGKPLSREGSSHLFKYIRLESYEDALNNLQLKSTDKQQSLLTHHDKLREDYMLSYMLDVESHGSASLLNTDAFKDPFGYQMKIARGNETKDTTIDLMETFNYLLGIKVLRISAPERRSAEFERDGEGRLKITGKPRSCNAGEGWLFREVEGATLGGEKVLIIWRILTGNAEEDNLMLENYFSKRNYSTLDFEFNRIYVNGDNNLENLKIGEEQWKVALIEEEFKRLMFDVEGV
jgi:adenine-specific DNA-methyltransferase